VSLCLFALVLVAAHVLRIGEARELARAGLSSGSLAAADEGVRLSPRDPEAYRARAATLVRRDELSLAVADFRRAIALRRRDYRLWVELATTLDKQGDTQSALVALSEAQMLAPTYAAPHWEAGLLLNKLGRRNEALKEFRSAAMVQPSLLPKVIDFAWESFAGAAEMIQQALEPKTNFERLSLALFFIRKEKPVAALGLIRSISNLTAHDRKQLLGEFLRAEQFSEAYEFWADSLGNGTEGPGDGVIFDGGFERARLTDEIGFGWRLNRISGIKVAFDGAGGRALNHSLRIDWLGDSNPSDEAVSQLVLVAPNTTYQLSFAARAENLMTGGAPMITVTSAHRANPETVAASAKLPLGTTDWQSDTIDFKTTDSTRAIRLALKRANCAEPLCPIFGSLWLDDFSLLATSEVAPLKARNSKPRTPVNAHGSN
jgi:hypothetical protein